MDWRRKNKTRKNPPGAGYAYIIIAIGVLTILGWILDFPILTKILPSGIQINPVSAILFILSGVALLHLRSKKGLVAYCIFPACIICIFALLKLSIFVTGYDNQIDTLFIHSLSANRMAPNSALNFLLCGLSIIFISSKSEKRIFIGQIICLGCFLISVLAIMGYLYSIRRLYNVNEYIPMAFHTAACFVFLCTGIFTAKLNNGFIATISTDSIGGRLSRRLLPIAVILPIILGLLHFEAIRTGLISPSLGASTLILLIILAFSTIIWLNARTLNKIDSEWEEAEKGLVVARNKAEKARRAQEQFLANMSHEIRTPMNGVIGMTSLLQGTPLTEDQLSLVNTIRLSGESLLVIINDILDFTKIEAGKLELEQQPFSIQLAIEDTFDLLANEANKKDIQLLYSLKNDVPPEIVGDITRLRQILVNLVSNGIKFTEKGEILISVSVKSKHEDENYDLQFKVTDTGIGIPEDKIDRLFKAFSQTDESITRKFGGTGLGLAICAKLVKMMNGEIGVQSDLNKGSVFFFNILAKAQGELAEKITPGFDNLSNKSVLIADDNLTSLQVLSDVFDGWGMFVTACSFAKETVDAAKSEKFDLIIIEDMKPEMSGIEMAWRIKDTENATTPIVLLSASAAETANDTGHNKLFAETIMKPVRINQLGHILNSIFKVEGEIISEIEKIIAPNDLPVNLAHKIPLRILVAEDNMINQKIALKVLEKLGYFADLAANGLETVDSLERQPYDMILMDMIMPEMDGIEATQKIRTMNLKNQPIIIALTANAMQGEKEKCIQCGMNDFLSKPFQISDLENIILKWKGEKVLI